MNILSESQFLQLQSRVNSLPWAQFEPFLSWKYNGRNLTVNDFPDASDARRRQIINALDNMPNEAEQNEWENVQSFFGANTVFEMQGLLEKINSYISRWSGSSPSGNHLAEANAKKCEIENSLKELTASIEAEAWSKVNHFNIDSLLSFLKSYPYTDHREEIDESVFSIAKSLTNASLVDALRCYKENFPQGKHIDDVENLLAAAYQWNEIKRVRELFSVFSYVSSYSDSPFIKEARQLLMELKSEELALMKRSFNEYSRERMLSLISNGVFTEYELVSERVATPRSIEILRNYQLVRESLPVLDDVIPQCTKECFPNHVDVFMFGIPATGKSCVLAGLLNSPSLHYDSVRSGGKYADALSVYLENNCPPDPTRRNYLTTIKADVKSGDKAHLFDLVEMAGEEFADKIANNPNNEVSFEDMGTGAAELLSSANNKVFFLVVDPTKNTILFTINEEVEDEFGNKFFRPRVININQRLSIKRMIDLFGQPENADVMNKVDAIHFIVTKADTLGNTYEERLDKAVDIMRNNYQVEIDELMELCSRHGINRATSGVPYVFPFSLGQFYVGNICEYDDHDSNSLLNVMKGNTMAIRKDSFWDKFKSMMNKGF